MGILDQLTSATGDKASNQELVKQCLRTPALLHSVAEGLRTGVPAARVDCAQILLEVGQRRGELLGVFVADFLDASRARSKRVARLALAGLALAVQGNPAEVYAERDSLLELSRGGDARALAAAGAVAALCGANANYRGKLLGHLLRTMSTVSDRDLPRWVDVVSPAVAGSAEAVRKLELALQARVAGLPDAAAKRLRRALTKLHKSTVKRP